MSAFGDEIRRLREAKGWTLDEVTSLTRGVEAGGPVTFAQVLWLYDVYYGDADYADLARLLRLSGCALPDGVELLPDPQNTLSVLNAWLNPKEDA